MTQKKREQLETRIERRFQEIKRRDEIKQRYGVFTQKMLESLFDKKLDEKLSPIKQRLDQIESRLEKIDEKFERVDERLGKIEKRLDWVAEKIDWIYGKYQGHDQEHTLISDKLAEHSDQLERIKDTLGIQTV